MEFGFRLKPGERSVHGLCGISMFEFEQPAIQPVQKHRASNRSGLVIVEQSVFGKLPAQLSVCGDALRQCA